MRARIAGILGWLEAVTFALAVAATCACTPPVVQGNPPVPRMDAAPSSADVPYVMQVGDALAIKFYRNPELNEEVTIRDSVLSFLTIEYPNLEVVVVNDGSKDRTMQAIIEQFELYQVPPAFSVSVPSKPVKAYYRSRLHSRLLVLDKENGGKADALNAAMNAARHPFVVSVDADTIIEPDALLRLARPFLLYPNIAAVGGTIRVVNSCTVE